MNRSDRFYLLILILFVSCSDNTSHGFKFLPSSTTGITFNNHIPESDIINILSFEYIYNGGGVGVADFNKDGLQDLFFTGNFVDNKLYLNEGDFQFKDLSSEAGIEGKQKWCTGVSIVDINRDSYPDIYVSVNSFNTNEVPNNLLYINQGPVNGGGIAFEEMAAEYGVQGGKHTMHAAFFDYDLDGDLDLYLLNNVLDLVSPSDYRTKQIDGNAPNNDQFFRNNGDETFTDVSKEAGVTIEGYGLGLAVTDINLDGYPDIYVTNDYITNDLLYINQQDGTFRNEIDKHLKKQSKFSMGVASVDFNNDTRNDFFVLDMLANTNERLKKLNGSSNYNNVNNNRKYGYQEQNVRNMLQVNNGNGRFTEVGYYAGLATSDWSWTPLCEDFDSDGDVDIYITNGFPKDVTDLDFINFKANRNMSQNRKDILNEIPEVKISNLFFENRGDLKFENTTKKLGLEKPSFSNGAVAVDLDNDGDLDIVTNNINDEASIIENRQSNRRNFHFEFASSSLIGSKVYVSNGDTVQYKEYFPHKSYLSSTPSSLHFGLSGPIDSVIIVYPDGRSERMIDLADVDKVIVGISDGFPYKLEPVRERDSLQIRQNGPNPPLYFDTNLQTTILTDYSHSLPQLIETADGILELTTSGEIFGLKGVTTALEIEPDFLVVSRASYQNQDTINQLIAIIDGEANFDVFKTVQGQHSILRRQDIDNDGDQDLFLGSQYVYGQYPKHYTHYIAINNGDRTFDFLEVAHDEAIMDAQWVNDQIYVIGHWQGLSVYNSDGSKAVAPIDIGNGLWNTILVQDLNGDSIADFMFGNMGTNTNFKDGPIKMIATDQDENGTIDPLVFFKYEQDADLVPLDLKEELTSQVPMMRKKYADYQTYTNATIADFTLPDSKIYMADNLHSVCYLSTDTGFRKVALPEKVQWAPILVSEMLGDTLFLGGNISMGREFWGSFSSSSGHWLQFKNSNFSDISDQFPPIDGDIRSILMKDGKIYIGKDGNQIVTLE